jgi:alginate O-acetyltransferase complex protein AlgI
MIFSSIEFIFFFIISLILLKFFKRFQQNLIIILSLIFYSFWNVYFVFLILYFCFFTYFFIKNRYRLKISIFFLISPLIYFKYSIFILKMTKLNFLLEYAYYDEVPLAISFITFTAIAAVIDVKKNIFNKDSVNFFSISEFILFFPQLIAGPILRLNELIPQLKKKIVFKKEYIKLGLVLFLIGFVKKIFFADNIAIFIDPIFESPELFQETDLFKSFILFPLQIYFDFSGYIDMALGSSLIIGIELPPNFNKPYLTSSLTLFWRNWHITLSRWFKDYLFIPLGGSKKNQLKTLINLIITMTVAGLWHGASINFIIWGFLNGIILYIEKVYKRKNITSIFRIFINCFIIFNLWIIFRISEIDDLLVFFKIFYSTFYNIFNFENIILIFVTFLAIYSQKFDNILYIKQLSKKMSLISIVLFFICIIFVGLAINLGTSEKFIYFQF